MLSAKNCRIYSINGNFPHFLEKFSRTVALTCVGLVSTSIPLATNKKRSPDRDQESVFRVTSCAEANAFVVEWPDSPRRANQASVVYFVCSSIVPRSTFSSSVPLTVTECVDFLAFLNFPLRRSFWVVSPSSQAKVIL